MKQYKIIQAYYKGSSEKILEVPDDMVFLCNPNEIGDMKYNDYIHCLGITLDKSFKCGEKFGNDIILSEYNNIKPIDELPIISSEEAENRFHFTDYYIYKYTNGYYENIDMFNPNKEWKYTPERLFSCSKILKFNSLYNIEVTEVLINSWMAHSDIEVKIIDKNTTELNDIFNVYKGYSIITKDFTLFNKAVNTVLNDYGINNFNKYDEFIAEQYEKEDEFWKKYVEELDSDWKDDF